MRKTTNLPFGVSLVREIFIFPNGASERLFPSRSASDIAAIVASSALRASPFFIPLWATMRSTISFLVNSGASECPPAPEIAAAFVGETLDFGVVLAAALGVVLAARVVERLVFIVLVGLGLVAIRMLDPAIGQFPKMLLRQGKLRHMIVSNIEKL
nr:hypothetical protein [Litoreibacter meonggei]